MNETNIDWSKINFPEVIEDVCANIAVFLIDKNEKYGNSVGDPIRAFSKLSPIDQIDVRIDDKINRMIFGDGNDTEDTEKDLLGYLILKSAILEVYKSLPDFDQKTMTFKGNGATSKRVLELINKDKGVEEKKNE